MNWEAIGAIGETLGAIGVIMTLAYLAIQIRQNTRASKAATVQDMTNKWVQINLFIAEHDIHTLFSIDLTDTNADPDAVSKAMGFYRALFHQYSNNHYQYCQGVLDEALFQPTIEEIRVHSRHENFILAWSYNRFIYNDNFGAFMDGILAEGKVD